MKVRKVKLITEEARKVAGTTFVNSTDDQFPYVESAINTLDNNFNWWKDNWPEVEQLIGQYLNESRRDSLEKKSIEISSRFTVFHGTDEKAGDAVWTGPSIVYTLAGATALEVEKIKSKFGGMYEGKKIFTDKNQLIFLFG